jgi:hypothetical protein
MENVVVKFAGGESFASSVGSKNPVAAMLAQMILSGPEYAVEQAQEANLQSVGNLGQSAAGGIGF